MEGAPAWVGTGRGDRDKDSTWCVVPGGVMATWLLGGLLVVGPTSGLGTAGRVTFGLGPRSPWASWTFVLGVNTGKQSGLDSWGLQTLLVNRGKL